MHLILPNLIVILGIITHIKGQLNFTAHEQNTGFIFSRLANAHLSHDTFNLLYFYDTKTIRELSSRIELGITQLRTACTTNEDTTCEITTKLINEQYEMAKTNLANINQNMLRKRRFILCEWCGKFQHILYGTMDAENARMYASKINELQKGDIDNRDLIRNQSKIVKAIIDEDENIIKGIESNLRTIQYKFRGEVEEVENKIHRRDLSQVLGMLVDEFKSLISSIRQSFISTKTGEMPQILRSEQIKKDIEIIAKSLTENQAIPIEIFGENILQIFKYSTIKSNVWNTTILIEIKLPITDRERFILFKATPVPINAGDLFFIPNLNNYYFMTNWKGNEFIELTEKELNDGIMMTTGNILYRTHGVMYSDPKQKCLWSHFLNRNFENLKALCNLGPVPRSNYITAINENDLYYLTIIREIQIWEICRREGMKLHSIKTSGFLQLKPDCTIKSDDFTLVPHVLYLQFL